MSEQSNAPETGVEQTSTTEQAVTEPKPTETVEFWKAKAREQEKRAKDNAAAATRLAEIEDAQKTESQKAADALTREKNRADAAEAALLRFEVAAAQGVPANAIKFLTGSSREEIEASAKDVLELIGDAGKPRSPKPDPTQGRSGTGSLSTADQFAAAIEGSFTR